MNYLIKTVLSYLFFHITNVHISAQTDQEKWLAAIKDIDLPIVEITTVDGEMPTYEVVTHPEGAMGNSITNATKVPARMTIRKGKDIIYDSGEYEEKESGITIKVRGNTSALMKKKSYKLKLQTKADLLHRGNDEKYRDKNWLLLKDDNFYTIIGNKVNELMELQWTPQGEYVNVIVNGEYFGFYYLSESVERNDKCRINVDKKSGYIFEFDAYWWNEDLYVQSPILVKKSANYTFKYPDSDDITDNQLEYFTQMIYQVENSLITGTYPEHLDVESLAAWMLAHDILGNRDSGGSNIYMTKYDNTSQSKVKMACLWDFDHIFEMDDNWDRVHNSFYFKWLFPNKNSTFLSCYKDLWKNKGVKVVRSVINWLQEMQESPISSAINQSKLLDNERWHRSDATIDEQFDVAIDWFERRKVWLDMNILGKESSVDDVDSQDNNDIYRKEYYTIGGVKSSKSQKGSNIVKSYHSDGKVSTQKIFYK